MTHFTYVIALLFLFFSGAKGREGEREEEREDQVLKGKPEIGDER